jgi:alpha-ketoglutarate-dependent taurine dioxygenase
VTLESFPTWSFDGSSTYQAAGHDSDLHVAPKDVSFGKVPLNHASPQRSVKLTNPGSGPDAVISKIRIVGDFSQTNDCPDKLHAKAGCTIKITFKPVRVGRRFGMLMIVEGSEHYPEAEFADLRAAYDALPAEKKRQLEGLVAEHSIFHSRGLHGFTEFNANVRSELPPVPQVLVRTHAGSGRKTLYLASHASHIIGWPVEEGRALIEELVAFATQPRFVYRHHWRVGDLVIWDDRCTMHRGRPYDEANYRRVLHRTTVSDEVNSVERERGAQSAA